MNHLQYLPRIEGSMLSEMSLPLLLDKAGWPSISGGGDDEYATNCDATLRLPSAILPSSSLIEGIANGTSASGLQSFSTLIVGASTFKVGGILSFMVVEQSCSRTRTKRVCGW
jgi:hypothetical protein